MLLAILYLHARRVLRRDLSKRVHHVVDAAKVRLDPIRRAVHVQRGRVRAAGLRRLPRVYAVESAQLIGERQFWVVQLMQHRSADHLVR